MFQQYKSATQRTLNSIPAAGFIKNLSQKTILEKITARLIFAAQTTNTLHG
jgi:hypothetical protein